MVRSGSLDRDTILPVRGSWGVSLVLVTGCFSKPSFVEGGPIDGPSALCEQPFSAPSVLTELTGSATGEPSITADGLQLYWMLQTGGSQFEVHHADRLVATDAFTTRDRFMPIPIEATDQDPSVSGDGNLIVYRGLAATVPRAYFIINNGSTWSTPALVSGLEDQTISALDLSPDGLTLYFTNGSNNLRRATRPNLMVDFVYDATGLGADLTFPTVAADGRELFYHDGSGISRVIRPDTSFGWQSNTAMQVLPSVFDPDLSPDGTRLYVGNGNGISVATRTCP